MPSGAWIFAFDNHEYKTGDGCTRHQNCRLETAVSAGQRSMARRLLVSGTVDPHIAHPTATPASKHGAQHDSYRVDLQRGLDFFFDGRTGGHVRHGAVWSITSFRVVGSQWL